MKSAAKIDAHLKKVGVNHPNAVRVVVLDGDTVHCMNEGLLDAWWNSLPAVTKAEIYELTLGDDEERCRYCGCTENRACEGGCAWLNREHTVCSAPACAEKYKASLTASLADSIPVSAWINEPVQEHAKLVGQLMHAVALGRKGEGVDVHC